jgi:hypothetical protein
MLPWETHQRELGNGPLASRSSRFTLAAWL